jgi:hypothetical protein
MIGIIVGLVLVMSIGMVFYRRRHTQVVSPTYEPFDAPLPKRTPTQPSPTPSAGSGLDELRRSSLDDFDDDELSFDDDFQGPSRRRRQVFPFEDGPILDELPGYGDDRKSTTSGQK